MKAFILAAGLGERLRPLTFTVPKSLVPVSGIPSIVYSLYLLREAGITDIIINLHWLPDEIKHFFAQHNNFGFNISWSFEEDILGTGGGLKQCEDFFGDDEIVMINSDIITDINLGDMIASYRASPHEGTIAVSARGFSAERTVSVKGGIVADFRNNLETGIAPEFDYMGIAVLSPEVFKYLEAEFSSVVYTGFTGLVRNNSLGFVEHRGVWLDIGTMASLNASEKILERENDFLRSVSGFYHEFS